MNTRSASLRVALRWLLATPEYSSYLERKKRQNKKPLSKEDWTALVNPDTWGKEPGKDSPPPKEEAPKPPEGEPDEPVDDHRGDAATEAEAAKRKKEIREAQAAAEKVRGSLKGVGLTEDQRSELIAELKKLDAIAATLMGVSPEQYDEDRQEHQALEFRSLNDSDPKVVAAAKKYSITDSHLKKFVYAVEGDPKLVKRTTKLRKRWSEYKRDKADWDKAQEYQKDKEKYDSDLEKYEAYDEATAEATWEKAVEIWEKKPKAERGEKPKLPKPPKEPKLPREPSDLDVKEPEKPDEPEPDKETELSPKQRFEAFKKHASPESKEKLEKMTLDEFEDLMEAWAGGKSGGRYASLRASTIRLAYTLGEHVPLRVRLLRVLA